MLRKVEVTVEITFNDDDVSDVQVSELVKQMLEVGKADATESSEDPDIDGEDAELASELEIGDVYIKQE